MKENLLFLLIFLKSSPSCQFKIQQSSARIDKWLSLQVSAGRSGKSKLTTTLLEEMSTDD